MKVTRERKALIAVAVLATTAFLGDRVLMGGQLTGPQTAAAATAPGVPATASASVLTTPDVALADEISHGPSVAQRLDQVRSKLKSDAPDPFAASNLLASEPTRVAAKARATFDPRAFSKQHPLDAVTANGQHRRAIVNGKLMSAGDTLDGVTLESIGDRSVIWSGHDTRFRVRLHPG